MRGYFWSPVFLLPLGLVQKCKLFTEPVVELASLVICLPWDAPSISRHRLVSAS
jgi:hypothetical protein